MKPFSQKVLFNHNTRKMSLNLLVNPFTTRYELSCQFSLNRLIYPSLYYAIMDRAIEKNYHQRSEMCIVRSILMGFVFCHHVYLLAKRISFNMYVKVVRLQWSKGEGQYTKEKPSTISPSSYISFSRHCMYPNVWKMWLGHGHVSLIIVYGLSLTNSSSKSFLFHLILLLSFRR